MSDWKIPLGVVALALLLAGVTDRIAWILWPLGVLVTLAVLVLLAGRVFESGAVPSFHGHGPSRQLSVSHEKRHKRVLNGQGIRDDGYSVWREGSGWAGVTRIDRSPANMQRWEALSPAQKAAVYMAGAMGPEGNYGCGSDLAEVAQLGVSPSAARRVARRYL